MKTIGHSCLALFFLCALAATSAWAEPTQAAPVQPGKAVWSLDAGFSGAWVPSWEDDRPFLSAAGFGFDTGIGVALNNWIPFRASFTAFSVGRSELDENLFLYRPFWGMRFAAETGWSFSLAKTTLTVLGGTAFTAYEYTGTSLVGAYWSALASIRFQFPVPIVAIRGLKASIALPLEFMWRGAARSLGLGLTLGASVPIGNGR